jgi:hypothetical protein
MTGEGRRRKGRRGENWREGEKKDRRGQEGKGE